VASVNRQGLATAIFGFGKLTRFQMPGCSFDQRDWRPLSRVGKSTGFAGGGPPLPTIHE